MATRFTRDGKERWAATPREAVTLRAQGWVETPDDEPVAVVDDEGGDDGTPDR